MVKPVNIQLTRSHTHMGTEWAAGAFLAVHPHTADWLIAAGVATLGQAQDPTIKTQKD